MNWYEFLGTQSQYEKVPIMTLEEYKKEIAVLIKMYNSNWSY